MHGFLIVLKIKQRCEDPTFCRPNACSRRLGLSGSPSDRGCDAFVDVPVNLSDSVLDRLILVHGARSLVEEAPSGLEVAIPALLLSGC